MTEKYLLIYQYGRGPSDTWVGTLDEYEKFSAELDADVSEDGWSMIHFAKIDEQDEFMFRR